MTNVAILGEFDSDNVGDQLIGIGGKLAFETLGFEAHSFPLNSSGRRYAEGPQVKSGRRRRLKPIHRQLRNVSKPYRRLTDLIVFAIRARNQSRYFSEIISTADIVVIGGGQLIGGGALHIVMQCRMVLREARKLNKPVMFVGIGVGTPKTRIACFIFAKLFRQMGSSPVLVRDSNSASVANSFLPPSHPRAVVNPDNAFVAVHALKSDVAVDPIPGLVGLAPISRYVLSGNSKQFEVNSDYWWISLVTELRSRSFNPVLFCNGSYRDFERCQVLKKRAAEERIDIRVLDRPNSAGDFLEQLTSFEHILCQRLHISIAFFALGGCPTALAWDEKVEAFYRENQLGHRVLTSAQESISSTCDLITSEAERAARAERLASTVTNGIRSALREIPGIAIS